MTSETVLSALQWGGLPNEEQRRCLSFTGLSTNSRFDSHNIVIARPYALTASIE